MARLTAYLLPPEILSGATADLHTVLNHEPPSRKVLIGVAAIDKALNTLLRGFLIDSRVSERMLHPATGLFGCLAARSDVVYALGLITVGMLHNLRALGAIHTRFAGSSFSLDFANPEIIDLCEQLRFPAISDADAVEAIEEQMASCDLFL